MVTFYTNDHAGVVTNVTYSDGTPSVTTVYDRRGRPVTITQGSIVDSLSYNNISQLLGESFSNGPLSGVMVTNVFDALNRRSSVSALGPGSTALATAAYRYDAASRLYGVSDGTNSATYSYLANSPIVGQIAFQQSGATRMMTQKTYDYVNRLTSTATLNAQASTLSSFQYQNNAANQRTNVLAADGSYWVYQYDALGQVISGKRYWSDGTVVAGEQFTYGFDTIGNRQSSGQGGDQNGANLRPASYTANLLNQYTQRTVPGAVDIIGSANSNATVTVNVQRAYRKGNYYWEQLGLSNATAEVWQPVTNLAVLNRGTNTDIAATNVGNVFLPQTPENYAYDADGNLLSDGRWTNTWDAENRLVSMTSLASAPAGSKFLLLFAYDYQGRRTQKVVSTNNGSSYVVEYTNNYVYDGWNCVAVLNASLSLLDSFLWGTDLSGDMQGAGGVGGLIKVSNCGAVTTNCFVAYDANGNVSTLVNASNGSALGNYDYGPFGEVIRATGPMAKANPYRFSTKYQDDETDLIVYPYRPYSPSTGRWLSRDPLEEADGPAIYAYTHNDPLDFADPFGLSCSTYRYEFELGQFLKWVPGMEDPTKLGNLVFRAQFTRCDACCSGKRTGHDVQFAGGVAGKFESPRVHPISWLPIVYLQADVSANFNVQIDHKFCPNLWSGGGCGTIQIGGKAGLDRLPPGWSAYGGLSGGCQLCVKADKTSPNIQVTIQCFASEQIHVGYRFFRHIGSYTWLWQQKTSPSEIASFSVD